MGKLIETLESAGRPQSKIHKLSPLLPEIQEALGLGYSRRQVVDALRTLDIDLTPAQLTTYMHRLVKRGARSADSLPVTRQPRTRQVASAASAPARSAVPAVSALPPGAPAPASPPETALGPSSKYPEGDPRRIDEIRRQPVDLKAAAKSYTERHRKR